MSSKTVIELELTASEARALATIVANVAWSQTRENTEIQKIGTTTCAIWDALRKIDIEEFELDTELVQFEPRP